MIEGKIIFESYQWSPRRYEVYGVRTGYLGGREYFDSSYEKKASAIARAEHLISSSEYDKVVVTDTWSEE